MRRAPALTARMRPYSGLAPAYDDSIGLPFFRGLSAAFERLIARYGIRFNDAADLGCGTGLFARFLNQRFRVPVIAVDRSTSMLDQAAQRCRDADVRLLCQDIRTLVLPHAVDLVTANFDTLNHLLTTEDLRNTLRRIAISLAPGGHFIFDFVTDCQPRIPYRVERHRFRRRVQQSIRWDPERRLLSVAVTVASSRGRAPVAELHHERVYSPREMTRHLLDAGFIIRGVHDARTLEPAQRCGQRLIVVAQRR